MPESTSDVARFSFKQLCGQPLSAADYLEVTRTFRTVFVTDVPKMGLDKKDGVYVAVRIDVFAPRLFVMRTRLALMERGVASPWSLPACVLARTTES